MGFHKRFQDFGIGFWDLGFSSSRILGAAKAAPAPVLGRNIGGHLALVHSTAGQENGLSSDDYRGILRNPEALNPEKSLHLVVQSF